MKQAVVFAVAIGLSSAAAAPAPGRPAPQTWTGYVSDSQCGADHGGEVDPKECTLKCVAAGDKFVLVADQGMTIVPIANQNFAGLREHAGEEVNVTGELHDGAITVTKIDAP
jgi:hypothetical protein